MSRVKFNELRQGVTVYTVHAFAPYRKGVHEKQGSVGWVEKHRVMGRPRMHTTIGFVVDVATPENRPYHPGHIFLSTLNVVTPACSPRRMKNNHGCFWSAKAAERHLQRISSGCLTQEEWERAADWKEFLDEIREMEEDFRIDYPEPKYSYGGHHDE